MRFTHILVFCLKSILRKVFYLLKSPQTPLSNFHSRQSWNKLTQVNHSRASNGIVRKQSPVLGSWSQGSRAELSILQVPPHPRPRASTVCIQQMRTGRLLLQNQVRKRGLQGHPGDSRESSSAKELMCTGQFYLLRLQELQAQSPVIRARSVSTSLSQS